MNNEKLGRLKFEDLLSLLPKFIGGFVAVFIFDSIIYEYMYFWRTSPELLSFFVPTDFLKLSINWLPGTLIGGSIAAWLLYDELNKSIQYWEAPSHTDEKNIKIKLKFWKYALYFICSISVISLPFAKWGELQSVQLPAYALVGSLITKQIFKGRLPITIRPIDAFLLYTFIGWRSISAAFGGLNAGAKDLTRTEPLATVTMLDNKFDAIIIRSIDKGIIFKKKEETHMTFVPWNQIKELATSDIKISEKRLYEYFRDKFIK